MTLSTHIDPSELENSLLAHVKQNVLSHNEQYISDYDSNKSVPKYAIPENSADEDLILRYMGEELTLDGIPNLNLASFVNTDVNDRAMKLISNNIVKNLADNDEYPSLIEYQQRCISILANLWHAPKSDDGASIGTATTGSSEAIMLAGLAMKKRWQERRRKAGKSTENPNILMASVAQVALEKFARYFDVENRTIPVCEESGHLIEVSKIRENIDENTIGIFVILGSTFTGGFEPVEEIAHLLDDLEKETGLDVPIHVDGASGAFVAPFVYPNLKWDFAVDRVVSINTSGHKFGLTTAGLGWVIWRSKEYLPETLRFKLDYLGGVEETFGLNFSRPGFTVLHQYFNFLTLGREGYRKKFHSCLSNARLMSEFLLKTKYFDVLSCIHIPIDEAEAKKIYTFPAEVEGEDYSNQKYKPGLPVVAFRFSKEFRDDYPDIPQGMLSVMLRNKQIIVPNYHLTPDEEDKEILRVVVRDSLSLSVLEKLMDCIVESTEVLMKAHDGVGKAIRDNSDAETRRAIVSEVLLSIVSNGSEDLALVQKTKQAQSGHEHGETKKSYRGTC